jgi:tRNA(Arg) A34 adenosine deaminase TadA
MPAERMLRIQPPDWVEHAVDWQAAYTTDEQRMGLAIQLARENVVRGTGGPFGSAVFRLPEGALLAVGVNSVTRLSNSMLHAEVMAIMLAQQQAGSYTLDLAKDLPHALVTSCEPCAMCLGATLWSGVRRLVCGATREDATALGFDEGPVFPESYAYLESRGIGVARGVLRQEAAEVLRLYQQIGGQIYNA